MLNSSVLVLHLSGNAWYDIFTIQYSTTIQYIHVCVRKTPYMYKKYKMSHLTPLKYRWRYMLGFHTFTKSQYRNFYIL